MPEVWFPSLIQGSKEFPESSHRAKSTVPYCCCTTRIQLAGWPGGWTANTKR